MPHPNRMSWRTLLRSLILRIGRPNFLASRYYDEAEMRLLQAMPKNMIDVAIDVGASIGAYSWLLHDVSRKVICIDADAGQASALRVSAVLTSMTVLTGAASAQSGGDIEFHWCPGRRPLSRVCDEGASTEGMLRTQVRRLSLDADVLPLVEDGRNVDFIKIDVEGHEHEVVRGCERLLHLHHPVFLIEIEHRHNPAYGLTFDLLASRGYECFVSRNGNLRRFDPEWLIANQGSADLVERLARRGAGQNAYLNNFIFIHEQSRLGPWFAQRLPSEAAQPPSRPW